jgi:hypothetical protein
MNASEVRIPHARLIVVIAALVASAAILWLSRNFTFYFDEWVFILSAPEWSWATLLQPHNEHPVMLTRAIYAVMLATVGLRSYLPYMALLLALHAATVVLLFEVVRRRAGDLIALGSAALLMVLGAGWEDLLWAFQIQFIGSVACGLGVLLALQAERTRRNLLIAAILLTASLMFSGVGLFFGVAAAVQLVTTSGRGRDLLWIVPVGAAVGVWFLAFGRNGAPATSSLLADIGALPLYVIWGLATSAGALIGVGGWVALGLLVAAGLAVAIGWRRTGLDGFGLGIVAGLVAFYAVTGLIRVQMGYQQAGASRYTYVGAVFWLLLLADAARFLPWRGTWRPAIIACLFLACFSSGVLLFSFAAAKTVQMQREVADLQALAAERSDPCLSPNGSVDLLVMPQVTKPALYYRAIDRYGDPSASIALVDRSDFDQARANLRTAGCK